MKYYLNNSVDGLVPILKSPIDLFRELHATGREPLFNKEELSNWNLIIQSPRVFFIPNKLPHNRVFKSRFVAYDEEYTFENIIQEIEENDECVFIYRIVGVHGLYTIELYVCDEPTRMDRIVRKILIDEMLTEL